jgi:hypothetical protein
MTDPSYRASVLAAFDAGPAEVEELLAYNENPFDHRCRDAVLADEPFVRAWRVYADEAVREGVVACLRRRLVQLRFPIREGISETEAYRLATRRGLWPDTDEGPAFEDPAGLRLRLHPTPAGHVPVLATENRADFVTLVRALTRRNEPVPLPDAMGAVMVVGYNNWDRIRAYREAWARRVSDASEAAWQQEFRRLIPRKEKYRDRFVLLSDGPYSAVPAGRLGLDERTWRQLSLVIRREHECAHYYTRRVLGAMRNNMLDELIADYMGITGAIGEYRADWFLRFVGLEAYPVYRIGGRLENYRGGLSDRAFRVLQALVYHAACNLERFGAVLTAVPDGSRRITLALQTLTRLTLEELASKDAAGHLERAYAEATAAVLMEPVQALA